MRAKVLSFKDMNSFCSFWDKEVEKCLADTTSQGKEYGDALREMRNDIDQELSHPIVEDDDRIGTYGYPVPISREEAMERRTFLNMELYNNKAEELSHFLSKLEKISMGILPKDVIVPNDRQLGVFSLERAFMSIDKILKLWSDKHKKFFFLNEGDIVYNSNGIEKKIKVKVKKFQSEETEEVESTVFKLHLDGSEAYMTQAEENFTYNPKTKVREGGDFDWGSNNRKSFLYKEKLPRPNRNIRIFVLVGGNAGQTEMYWAGVSAIMTCNFLQMKGYAVRVTACIEAKCSYQQGFNFGGEFINGHRVSIMDVKGYEEPINSLGLLYPLADASFYRIRCFDYFMTQQWYYKDVMNTGLYGSADMTEFRLLIEDAIKSREIDQEKDVLYYFVGGDDVCSLMGAKLNMMTIICQAEHNNKRALEKLGYEFNVPDTIENLEDFDPDFPNFKCEDVLGDDPNLQPTQPII